MFKKDLKTASILVNALINETLERYGQDPGGKCYLIRHSKESGKDIVVQPTHDDTFFSLGDYIHVAEVCGCSFYVTCEENQDGIIAPTLHIY